MVNEGDNTLLVAQHIPDAVAGKNEEFISLFKLEMPDLWDSNHHLHAQLGSACLLSQRMNMHHAHQGTSDSMVNASGWQGQHGQHGGRLPERSGPRSFDCL